MLLTHTIQKQRIDIHFDNFSEGIALQNETTGLFYEQLLPGMEKLFDELVGETHMVTIDRLEIDCGVLTGKRWQDDLVQEALRQLRYELGAVSKKPISTAADVAASAADDLLFFLENGRLPWNSPVQSMAALEPATPSARFIAALKTLLQSKPQAAVRLVNECSVHFVDTIIALLGEDGEQDSEMRMHLPLPGMPAASRKEAQRQLLKKYVDIRGKLAQKKETSRRRADTAAAPDSLYVNNAGLLLLHPFLPEMFRRLGLLHDGQWRDQAAQHAAVRVLEWLVTGREPAPEFNLTLNKIICGMAIDAVPLITDQWNPGIETECNDLLDSVIGYWTALKNTGREALRETFLQRLGKLTPTDHGWLLQVEQKAVDVLLNRLPWGIGVVKLPWMKEKIFVEWMG